MKKEEIGVALVGALIGAALIAALVVWKGWFAASAYSNGASNLLGIIAGPSIVAAFAVAVWRRWHGRCAVPRCVRLGEHPVAGCVAKVCSVHHTEEHHEGVFDRLHVEGMLGWGDSHHRGRNDEGGST